MENKTDPREIKSSLIEFLEEGPDPQVTSRFPYLNLRVENAVYLKEAMAIAHTWLKAQPFGAHYALDDYAQDSEEPGVWHFIFWLTTPREEAPRESPASVQTLETLLNTMKGIWARYFRVDFQSDHFQLVQQARDNIAAVKAAPNLDHLAELLTHLEVDPFEIQLSLLEAWWNPNPVPGALKLALSQVA